MNIDNKQVGYRIKNIRMNLGMTQDEFGNLFNATRSNVSKWEQGSSLPNKERLKQIAKISDISVEELLYGEQTISNSELERIEELTKENEQLKNENNQLKDENKDFKEIIETIKSIILPKEDYKLGVGNRIKNIRLELGDTMEEFGERIARKMNIDICKAPIKGNVSRWESGLNLPNKERLKTIAELGNITVEELLYGENNNNN